MLARLLLPFSLASLIGAAFWIGGASPRAGTAEAAPDAALVAWKPDKVEFRGVAMQLQTNYKIVDTFVPQLREIAALGANSVLLCPAGFMEHAKAQAIFIDMRKTPTVEEFKTLIREARKLKLQVIVMPLVLLSHPRGSEWRGQIEPPDWDDWWKQYREFMLYFTDIAAGGEADALMVGSELVSTERNREEWVKLIAEIRGRFPGKLGYSANWDHFRPVTFWDKLDFAGMTSYYTLADKDMPTVEEVAEKWRPIHKKIFEFQKEIGKPMILTEVGWCSQKGAARAPWDYYRNQTASADGLEEQRRLYEAFLRVFDGTPGLGGVIWWEWTQGDCGASDYGYSPKNKPAEKVLREWFAKYNGAATKGDAQDSSARPMPNSSGSKARSALHSLVGQAVRLEGRFDGPGKLADYVVVQDGQIYLMGKTDFGGDPYPYGSSVIVDGKLEFRPYEPPPASEAGSQKARPPDHFCIKDATLRLVPRT